jgi:hypothetical protein
VSETKSTVAEEAVEEGAEEASVGPPASKARKVAERTWWLPWLLGAAVLLVAVLVITGAFGSNDQTPEQQMRNKKAALPSATHTVVYEITGTGKSPEVRYVVDGAATSEKVEKVDLPWRKELHITVGPSVGIAQILAANSDADSISCTVTVDGQVVSQGVAPGAFSTVSCSAVVRPSTK